MSQQAQTAQAGVSRVTSKILPLTSVRFLAAFFVLLHHASPYIWWLKEPNFLGRTVALGYISVPFFFVLSGFVLALAYLASDRSVTPRTFYVARFARIYPALFACLLFDTPLYLHAEARIYHHSILGVLKVFGLAYTALEAWYPPLALIDVPSWSISAEFFFYLFFPFLAPALWKMHWKALCALAVTLFLGGNLLIVALLRTRLDTVTIDRNPITHVAEFLLGLCLARLYTFITRDPGRTALLRRLAPTLALSSLGAFLAVPFFDLRLPESVFQHVLFTPLFAAMILAFASGNPAIHKCFATSWFVLLGEASFALYLIQIPLIDCFHHQFHNHPIWFPPLFALLAVATSIASFVWLEVPSRHWILRRTRSRNIESEPVAAIAQ